MIERYTLPEIGEIWKDENRFRYWKQVELAVCRAQAKLGNIPEEALKTIEEKADFSVQRINEIEAEVDHDVIAFLTNLSEYIGPGSRYVHLGMTSSDLLDTTLALQCRDAGRHILAKLDEVIEAAGERAREFKDLLMLGRTHGVASEPITFGLKLALWYTELKRSRHRIERAVEQLSYAKISGAVGTFAHIDPKVEELVCEELSLKPAPVSNQIIQRDRHAEFLTSLAILGGSLEKFTTEIRNLQRSEILEVEEPFGKKQKGSSAMPHKRNPITCERVAGMARLLRANALAALENICLWHERDITHSSVERVILPDSTALAYYMLAKFLHIVKNMEVHPENMERNLKKVEEIVHTQGIMLLLTNKGMTREEAYAIVQKAAMESRATGDSFKKKIETNAEVKKVLSAEEINACFTIKRFTRHIDYIFKKADLL
ncbi:adenylosuccinate lyase [bacterium SM23_31]|nr:MAG: adenylosuccinate lyase [bacterium SM23_31]